MDAGNNAQILSTLADLVAAEQESKLTHKLAKTQLDAFIITIMQLPRSSRPTGDELAAVVGIARTRLYQIKHGE